MFRFFNGLFQICHPLIMSGISSVIYLLIQVVVHTVRLNFSVKSKPSGMISDSEPVWFNATMYKGFHHSAWQTYKVLIYDVIIFLSCKFNRLFVLLSVIHGTHFINFWEFLHGIAIFINMCSFHTQYIFLNSADYL